MLAVWAPWLEITSPFLSGPDIWNIQHGSLVEIALCFHLWEQSVWDGNFGWKSCSQYGLLQKRRLHSRAQGECNSSLFWGMQVCAVNVFRSIFINTLKNRKIWNWIPVALTIWKYWTCRLVFGNSLAQLAVLCLRWMAWMFYVSEKQPSLQLSTAELEK